MSSNAHVRFGGVGRGNRSLATVTRRLAPTLHKLVHEHGWAIARGSDGVVRWFRPSGDRYRAGPAPPEVAENFDDVIPPLALAAFG